MVRPAVPALNQVVLLLLKDAIDVLQILLGLSCVHLQGSIDIGEQTRVIEGYQGLEQLVLGNVGIAVGDREIEQDPRPKAGCEAEMGTSRPRR